MSDIRICVRGDDGDHWCNLHGSDGDRLIAACASMPRSLAELCRAAETYARGATDWVHFFHAGHNFSRWDAGRVIIDLTSRLIVVDSAYSDPQLVDQVYYHNGSCKTSTAIAYDLTADDWLLTKDLVRRIDWQPLANRRWEHLKGIRNSPEQSRSTFGADLQPNPAPSATH